MDSAALAFLTAPAGRGMTVLLLGLPDTALMDALAEATGMTGLVLAISPEPGAVPAGCWLRAAVTAVPVRSHVADVVLLTTAAAHEEPDAVVEEARRLLAPGGVLRATAPRAAAYRLLGELHAAAFRDAQSVPLGHLQAIRARGPR
jgi:hypothetical protein